MKKPSLLNAALIATTLATVISTAQGAEGAESAEPCAGLSLDGVYTARAEEQTDTIRFTRISSLPGATRVARVEKSSFGYAETRPGWLERDGRGYSIATLVTRGDRCAIAWYNAELGDHEYNLILERKADETLVLGGDFETYPIGELSPVKQ